MPNQKNDRPPHMRGHGFSSSGPNLFLRFKDNQFTELSRTTIRNAYSQIPDLRVKEGNYQVTAWSAAKHIHYSPDFGLDPIEYGMTQENLDNIAKKS